MKKVFLFSLMALLFLAAKGFANRVEAVFSASDRDRIQLIIDGQLVNETPQRQVYVQDRPGRHSIEIKVFNQWGRLQFVHNDQILVKPNSQNTFLLQVHPYGNVRLVQNTKTVPAKAAPARIPKPIKHHVPMVTFLDTQELRSRQKAITSQPSGRALYDATQKNLQQGQWLQS